MSNKRIGILGGGQLGLLLAQSLIKLGCDVAIYDPDPDAPACKQTARSYNGSWNDRELLEKFFEANDLVTYEFENVETALLFELQAKKPLLPSAEVLRITQNRAHEKNFMSKQNLPHPRFQIVEAGTDLRTAVQEFGLPCIAKTTFGGYDGKGQFSLEDENDLRELSSNVAKKPIQLILEERVQLDAEVSSIVATSNNGDQIVFPIFENQHRQHILDVTLLPARIPLSVQRQVQEISRVAARALKVHGLLTIEFFLTKAKPQSKQFVLVEDWYILINEFAPRPHNSGHITMKACDLSQFDILARILADVPIVQPRMVNDRSFCMGNLLGDVWLSQRSKNGTAQLDLSALTEFPEVVDVVIYGKLEAREKRKMGHFVATGAEPSELIKLSERFRAKLTVQQSRQGSS